MKKVLLLAIVFLVFIGVFCTFYFPLELFTFKKKWDLHRAGVKEQRDEGIHAFVDDHCSAGSSCTCVALLHGLGDDALTWKKILEWPKKNWEKMGLRQPYRIYAPDLPGSGESSAAQNREAYRVRVQAQQLTALLKKQCPQWILVGNSLGAWIAAWIALDAPDLVSRLILLSPAGWQKQEWIGKDTFLTEAGLREFQRRAYYKPREISTWVWKAIERKAAESEIPKILDAQVPEDSLVLRLPFIRVQTLVFWGKQDLVIPIAVGHQIRDQVPGVIWRETPECGHLPQKECPLPVIQSIIDLAHYGSM